MKTLRRGRQVICLTRNSNDRSQGRSPALRAAGTREDVSEETQDAEGSGAERPPRPRPPSEHRPPLCPPSPRPPHCRGLGSAVPAPRPGPRRTARFTASGSCPFPSSIPGPDGAEAEAQVPVAPTHGTHAPGGPF